MAGNPLETGRSNRENVADREVFYDLDERDLTNGTQILIRARVD